MATAPKKINTTPNHLNNSEGFDEERRVNLTNNHPLYLSNSFNANDQQFFISLPHNNVKN
jgi:hypothetical protein